MKRLAIALAALATTVAAIAASVTPPSKVVRDSNRTEYSFPIEGDKMAPLVIVVPDTTVPLQQIVVVNKTPPVQVPPKVVVTGSLEGAFLPGGVKSAKEALEVWPFAQRLEKSSAVFDVPETVKLGKSTEVRLVVDPTKLEAEAEEAGKNAKGEKIEISRVVVVKILAPDFDIIEVINDGRQVLNPSGPTEWRWTLTPKKIGEYKVNVTMSAVIEIGNDRAERLVKVFDQEVTVFVTPADAVKYFFTKNWQWLWSTLVLPFGIWVWKNKRKKKSLIANDSEE